MTAGLVPFPKFRAFDANGAPLVGGKLYTYQAGTSTLQATYTDETGGSANTNPVILDASGSADVWLGTAAYKFKLTDSADVQQWVVDNIQAANVNFGSADITASVNTLLTNPLSTLYNVNFTAASKKLYLPAANQPNSIQPGLPIYFYNSGAYSFQLVAQDLTTVIAAIPPAGFTGIVLKNNSTANGTYVVVPIPGAGSYLSVDANGNLQVNISTGLVSNGSNAIRVDPTQMFPPGVVLSYAYGGSAPTGWLLCDGAAVSRATYAALFAIISTNFGAGDGSTTFNVPDARGRIIASQDAMNGGAAAGRLTATTMTPNGTTLGATGGEQTHTNTIGEMPTHNHNYATGGGGGAAGGDYLLNTPVANVAGGTSIGTQGSGTPHNNVQPTILMSCIIKT